MAIYTLKRVAAVIPVLIFVTLTVFLAVHFSPGNPVIMILGSDATPEAIAKLSQEMGLDRPFLVQYVHWVGELIQGNFGNSYITKVSVYEVLLDKFTNTIILASGGLILTCVFGILIGVIAGIKRNSWIDRLIMLITMIGSNLPSFWLGIILVSIFSIQLGWLPSSGMYNMRGEETFPVLLKHLILPSIAIAASSVAIVARLVRASVIEIMNADYMQTLRSHGLSKKSIYGKHLLRSILSPVINITGLEVGYLLGGVLFVETVFSWPGIGTLLYNAIMGHDIPFIQAGVVLVAVMYVLVNLITDMLVTYLNPRLRQ
ncbi:ABC transporter permease [Paenibacillus endoradicis]|uniref:ABC transporter permease n=1 Tax=Paenibacillus endoradicis TaxID=2972487 RepID=UPI0021592E37|nr:ABC transporter permease [Paenibacillus endoradicis]MCR8655961.1 ABC transporter permease [Paenibacillus endoradicis]MCR8658287.1 ABC transporter permease [Paenibacillus endoradicis]